MQTYEEQKAFVSKLNVIDDVFFQKMAEDREVAEEILRIILEKPKLKVIDSKVQRFLRNIGAHSVVLDLICEDEDHFIINCEVQKEDDDDHQRRVRFNRSNIDTIFVEKGLDYKELPDVYIIFISKFDTFHENRTIYHIDRIIKETGTVVENGTHEVYVNIHSSHIKLLIFFIPMFTDYLSSSHHFPVAETLLRMVINAPFLIMVFYHFFIAQTPGTPLHFQFSP